MRVRASGAEVRMSDERARVFSAFREESEERIERVSRVGKAKARGFQRGKPFRSQDGVREGEAASEANVGRAKAELSPSKTSLREIVA
jgi:hypothetical protein